MKSHVTYLRKKLLHLPHNIGISQRRDSAKAQDGAKHFQAGLRLKWETSKFFLHTTFRNRCSKFPLNFLRNTIARNNTESPSESLFNKRFSKIIGNLLHMRSFDQHTCTNITATGIQTDFKHKRKQVCKNLSKASYIFVGNIFQW